MATKLEYPEESFPTLKPAFVVKVSGITNKYAAGPVHASGGLFAVVCLELSHDPDRGSPWCIYAD